MDAVGIGLLVVSFGLGFLVMFGIFVMMCLHSLQSEAQKRVALKNTVSKQSDRNNSEYYRNKPKASYSIQRKRRAKSKELNRKKFFTA